MKSMSSISTLFEGEPLNPSPSLFYTNFNEDCGRLPAHEENGMMLPQREPQAEKQKTWLGVSCPPPSQGIFDTPLNS